MSRRVLLEPEASAELEEVALWYEAQRSGLGLAFLAAVDQAVQHVVAWPDSGAQVPGMPSSLAVRQLPIARFLYRIAFLVNAEALRVLAVAHARRRPGYWHARAKP